MKDLAKLMKLRNAPHADRVRMCATALSNIASNATGRFRRQQEEKFRRTIRRYFPEANGE